MSGMKRLAPRPAARRRSPSARPRARPRRSRATTATRPVDVAADRIEVQDRADRAIFSGNVVVRQGELTLTAARLTVAYSSGGGVEIQPDRRERRSDRPQPVGNGARPMSRIYDLDRRIITLIGGVSLVQRRRQGEGGRLVIDLDSGRAVMDGGGPPGTSSQGGRVTGTLHRPAAARAADSPLPASRMSSADCDEASPSCG